MGKTPVQMFICHAPDDASWCERLLVHLAPLVRAKRVEVRHPGSTPVGTDTAAWTASAIASSDLIVILVSASLVGSEDVAAEQLVHVMEAGESGRATLAPVLVRHCAVDDVPWLARRKKLPADGLPIARRRDNEPEEEALLAEVTQAITRLASPADRPATVAEPPGAAESITRSSSSPRSAAELRVPQFHYGGVVPPSYFIGRAEELEMVEQLVRSRQNFLLVGERRAGKTSFCEALIHRVMGRPGNDVLVGKLNLESCQNLTLNNFLGHTLVNMIGEVARQVFGCHYSALLIPESPVRKKLSDDPGFKSLLSVHKLVVERIRIKSNAPASLLLPQEFIALTAELLELIANRGWGSYLIIYDEANHLASQLSIDLLMNNLEVLNGSRLTTAYAASPAMESSFDSLSGYLLRKVHLGPFSSVAEMRQLLARYYHDDANRTEDLPITEEAERLVWDLSVGTPFRIQCLLAYGFAHARRAHEPRVTSDLVERAWADLQRELPQYFRKR